MPERKKFQTCLDIGILLFPEFSNLCLANAIEPLRAVNTLGGARRYRWHFLSLEGGPVASSSGMTIQVDGALSRHGSGDYLFVMPSYGFRDFDTPACHRVLRAARGRFGRIVGMDTGSWLLAGAGLLSGRRATIHWDEQIAMAERFPDVEVRGDRVVDDGDILSCGGALTTFELILDLIERHDGALMRLEVAALFLDGDATRGDRPAEPLRPGQTPEAAMALMRRRIEEPMKIGEIAAALGLSRKLLERRCMERYGIGPRRLYLALRLREAQRLVGMTGMSVAEVAARCGYADAGAMTRAFRREFGITPRELRLRRDSRDLRRKEGPER